MPFSSPSERAGHAVPAVDPSRPFRSLVRYNLPYWRRYAMGSVLALFFVGIGLASPLVIRAIVDGFEAGKMTINLLLIYFAALLATAVGSGIARYYQRMLMIGSSRQFEYDLRNDFFAKLQSMSQRFFHKYSTGDLMARATNDLNYVRDFIGPGIMGTVDMVRLPFALGLMIYMSPKLTAIALIPLPFVSIIVYFFVRYLNRQSKVVQELFSTVTGRVQENLAGARVVKAYGIAGRELRDFDKASREYMRANIKLVAISSFAWPLIGGMVGAAVLMVIWNGGRMVIHDALSLGDLTAFLILMVMLAWPLAQFGWVLTLYQRGSVGMTRLCTILAEEPDIQDNSHTDPRAAVETGHIRFEGVTFSYDEEAVLKEISIDIPAGSTLAVVGPTGSGKTSLVSLLCREYEPDAGRILIDGTDYRAIPIRTLRGALGCVPQDGFIFSDSIRENIRLGRPDASDEQVMAACETAQFHTALENMPQGLDTLLGERGINLSGGQKQRLTLARAIVVDPRILILDDAMSSVDTHTEEQILEGLRGVTAGRTTVIISHRISTIREADQIVVLDDGRVVEQGRHDELVALGGMYAAMHERQQLEAALEEDGGEAA